MREFQEDKYVELFQTHGIVYELWIQYKDGVYCRFEEVDDITDALFIYEVLVRRIDVDNVYIRQVRTDANIILKMKGW